ncbi:MAG: peptidoglycan bridge formation glycyltransferase FemA/FemB family protein [Anaerolineae bacterium]|nr:peptidoglycan bridge formation glycyltransferase FemA/FemB family protein [Anaerolineae bacterium]MDW8068777.1 peptidoglycan bridge formation glycyltransferase FemA/FemB family protein [Anaerolineae bacterium]
MADPWAWNDALLRLPAPHVLQTWEWGAFKERQGWRMIPLLWEADGLPRAAALVLSRRASRFLPRVMYVPKGPLLPYEDESLLQAVLSDLETLARAQKALFLKIDPDVEAESPLGERVTTVLQARGWLPSPEQVQFRSTLLLDLRASPEEILARMKPKWRYNIRLAQRKGVTIREGTLADLSLLYRMYQETSIRDRFVIRPEEYYQDAWGTFIAAGLACPLVAEVAGEPVAMVILFRFGQRAWYMYGASRSVYRDWMPNHLLQWEAIRWARQQGCTVYDLWGAPDTPDESDPMWGVYRFKAGFGARLVRHIGAWDFPAHPLGYRLYMALMPRVLALMRWRYWQRQGIQQADR